MNHWARKPEKRVQAWAYVKDKLLADIALVQEAVPPAQYESVYRSIDPSNPRTDWGAAVVAISPRYRLEARPRRAAGSPSGTGALLDSHPGASAVADVIDAATGAVVMTAVSLYGQWEYLPKEDGTKRRFIYSAATLHRLLSDVTPLLTWRKKVPHKVPVVLAGDFNATTQVASSNEWEIERLEARLIFERIRALGLHDVIASTQASRPKLAGCSCGETDVCSHVQTYRNRAGGRPTQLDYAFASARLLPGVTCSVDDCDEAWSLSDHCPIVMDFEHPVVNGRP